MTISDQALSEQRTDIESQNEIFLHNNVPFEMGNHF